MANINISVCKGSNVDTAFGGNKQLWYARVGSWCMLGVGGIGALRDLTSFGGNGVDVGDSAVSGARLIEGVLSDGVGSSIGGTKADVGVSAMVWVCSIRGCKSVVLQSGITVVVVVDLALLDGLIQGRVTKDVCALRGIGSSCGGTITLLVGKGVVVHLVRGSRVAERTGCVVVVGVASRVGGINIVVNSWARVRAGVITGRSVSVLMGDRVTLGRSCRVGYCTVCMEGLSTRGVVGLARVMSHKEGRINMVRELIEWIETRVKGRRDSLERMMKWYALQERWDRWDGRKEPVVKREPVDYTGYMSVLVIPQMRVDCVVDWNGESVGESVITLVGEGVMILLVLLVVASLVTVLERKVLGAGQRREGPSW